MKCPICGIDIPDSTYKTIPCGKCGCMSLMDDDARLRWRAKSDQEAMMIALYRKRREKK